MEGSKPAGASPIFIIVLGILSATVVLTVYHCVIVRWCNPQRAAERRLRATPVDRLDAGDVPESIEFSMTQVTPPALKYSKEDRVVSEEQSTCAVCLSDFKDGEAVRLLPECLHCFHAPCIDMWLMSHTNCPMCRMATAPLILPVNSDGVSLAGVGTALPSFGG